MRTFTRLEFNRNDICTWKSKIITFCKSGVQPNVHVLGAKRGQTGEAALNQFPANFAQTNRQLFLSSLDIVLSFAIISSSLYFSVAVFQIETKRQYFPKNILGLFNVLRNIAILILYNIVCYVTYKNHTSLYQFQTNIEVECTTAVVADSTT